MLKSLKFYNPDDLFIVSDTHIGHNKEFLWGKRGFKSVGEHDETIIKNWNSKVRPTSTVIHLGDFCLNYTVDKLKDTLFKLNGHIIYLFGNHNSCIKELYYETLPNKEIEIYPLTWKTKLTFVGNILNFYVGKQFFVASHFPLKIWDYQNKNSVQLSGHSHAGDLTRNPDCFTEGKCLDCGIENFPYPMSITEIMLIINKKQYKKVDLHH